MGPAEVLEATATGEVVVVACHDDDVDAERHALRLRAEGRTAVARPVGGGARAAWDHRMAPVAIGERLCVHLPWVEVDRARFDAVVVLDAAGAFGAGSHPSTRLLLTALAGRLTGTERVLDVGCGTGVLALAAAALGAADVTAIDVDPVAVAATTANAARNGISGVVTAATTAAGALEGRFDVIVANIGAVTLTGLAADLVARLAPGGWVALSGISAAQASMVAVAYRPLEVVEMTRLDDWVAVTLVSR
jgi:ribosomal protein L11 methyltransferase